MATGGIVNGYNVTYSTAYDVKGIDKDDVPKITKALNTYQDALRNAVNKYVTLSRNSSLLNNAMKGTAAQSAFQNHILNLQTNANNLIKNLSRFQSALDTVVKSYETKSAANARESFK